MNINMQAKNSDEITQKDLLKLLFDQAQHNATREEVNALESRMDKQHNATREDINALEARMDKRLEKMDTKFDRLNWLLITTLIGVIASLALQII